LEFKLPKLFFSKFEKNPVMKTITIACCLLSFYGLSQSFNQANEPAIGNLVSLHLCDSNANILAGTMGNNVTWDFSQIAGVFGVTKDIQITDASLDPNIASFAGATKVYDIGGSLLTYFSSTTNDRTSQGFVFNEPALGLVIASWNSNNQLLMNYPFTYGNSTSDNFSGDVNTTPTGTIPAIGSSMTSVDGVGTLKLPGNNTYNNVVRFHLTDSASAAIFGTAVTFIRDVYEYYDLTTSNLPIFVTMNIAVNSPLFNLNNTLILSKDQPTTFLGIGEEQLAKLCLFPNPAQQHIAIQGIDNGVDFFITNSLGKTVLQGTYVDGVDVTILSAGLYYVTINGQVLSFTK